jgi:hypothetical protein
MGIVSAVVGQSADVSANTLPLLLKTRFVKVELITS